MKKILVLTLGLGVLGFGCAEALKIAPAFVGKFLTISIEPVVGFPAEPTLQGFTEAQNNQAANVLGSIFKTMTGESVKTKVGSLIAKNAEPYTVALTDAFKAEIVRRDLYRGVVDKGGNVSLRLSVADYGVDASKGLNALKPLLAVKGDIILPGWGVVWTRNYKVDEKSMKTLGLNAAQLLTGAASFEKVFASASNEAATALLAELK